MHDRKWRNEENENWAEIEDKLRGVDRLEDFLKGFDGRQMIQQSYNLFNKETVTEGALSSITGNVISGSYYVSDFIPVTPGQRLQIKPNIGVTAIYGTELNFIESVNSGDFPYVLPPGARYIRTQMSKASLDEKYVYLGEKDLPFVEYGWDYMPEFIEFVKNIAGESKEDYINLFNPATVVEGNLSTTTGEVTSGTYYISDFVEVQPLKEVQLRPNAGLLAIYDDDKNFIETITSSTTPKIIPSNGRYIRNRMSSFSVDEKYIYMGTEDMPYYPYGQGPNTQQDKHLKVLCVGNSYSNDTFWMLRDIAESVGKRVTVGISHLSGGTLSQVYEAVNNDETVTTYNKFSPGNGHEANTNYSARDIITNEDWDFIFFQQASTSAMNYDSYQPHLTNLVDYVRDNATNPRVRLGMNMPWVRPISNSTIGTPEKQIEVNTDIINACQQAMLDTDLEIFIPTGVAVMNSRKNDYLAEIGNELTRDGSHLDEGIGRYLAAMTVFNTLYGDHGIGSVSYKPSNVNPFHVHLAKLAAQKAVNDPFKVLEW